MKNIAKSVFWASVVALTLFTAAAGLGLLYGFDLWSMRVAQSRTSGFLDTVGEFFSTIGGIRLTVAGLILILAAVFFSGRQVLAIRVLIAFLAASAIEIAMKFWVPVTPLPDEFSRSDGYAPFVAVAYPYPYPSGHMLRTTILLGVIFILWKNRLGRVLLALILVGMSLSRVYMGVHWASDVIGGVLLGIAGLAWAFRREKGS